MPLKLIVALALAMLLDKGIRGVGVYRALFYLPSLLGALGRGRRALAPAVRARGHRQPAPGASSATRARPGCIDPDYALYTLIILAVWQFGSPMVIFLAGLRQIPTDLYEAASIDGAEQAAAVLARSRCRCSRR